MASAIEQARARTRDEVEAGRDRASEEREAEPRTRDDRFEQLAREAERRERPEQRTLRERAGDYAREQANDLANVSGDFVSADARTVGSEESTTRESDVGTVTASRRENVAEAHGAAGYDAQAVDFREGHGPAAEVSVSGAARYAWVDQDLRIESEPVTQRIAGEHVQTTFAAGLSHSIVAEGDVEVGMSATSDGARSDLGLEVGGEVFAGQRAGISAEAKLEWVKRGDYTDVIHQRIDWLLDTFGVPGSVQGMLSESDKHDAARFISDVLMGPGGTVDLIGVKAGAEVCAGIGADASLSLGIQEGDLHLTGDFGATVGLGVSGDVELDLALADGARFLALLLTQDFDDVMADLGASLDLAAQFASAALRIARYVAELPGREIAEAEHRLDQLNDPAALGDDAVVRSGMRDREASVLAEYDRPAAWRRPVAAIVVDIQNGRLMEAADQISGRRDDCETLPDSMRTFQDVLLRRLQTGGHSVEQVTRASTIVDAFIRYGEMGMAGAGTDVVDVLGLLQLLSQGDVFAACDLLL